MKPIVYIDMLFLLNFLLNSALLYITSVFLHKTIHILRLSLVSAIMALYTSVMFFPQLSFLYSAFFKVIFLVFSAYIAFPAKNLRCITKNTLMLFASSIILGGIMFSLIFLTDFGTKLGAVVSNGEIYLDINCSTLILATILAYFISYIVSYIKKENFLHQKNVYNITVFFNSNKLTIPSLCDTGCSLNDPISDYPAIIISPDYAKKLFSDSALDNIKNGYIPKELENRYRILPFSTVDNPKGIMHGFIPDKVTLSGIEIKKAVIALSNTKLHNFPAVFNPQLMDFSSSSSHPLTYAEH